MLAFLNLGNLLVLVACCHVLGLIAALHAVLHTRTSQGAIAWAISLVLLPYLTLVPYLFLGRRRFEGYVSKRRRRNLRLHAHVGAADKRPLSDNLEQAAGLLGRPTVRTLLNLTNSPFVGGNHVELLIDGAATFRAIFAAIEAAEHYVILQFFIVRDDELGQQLSQLLIKKARQGVKVYFLYDGIGCNELPQRYIDQLRAAGIEIQAFATTRFINRFQLNFRNHRKIVVTDGQKGFVGGLNIGDDYLGRYRPLAPWRDTHIAVEGSAVDRIQLAFIEDWYWATQRMPQVSAAQPSSQADVLCQVVASGPADAQETCALFFIEMINAAKHRLWMATPYFVPDEAVFAALRLAVLRGVDVRILIPDRSDHYMVYKASMLYGHDAVRAGIRVYRYLPGFLHQKVMLVDTAASIIGSANLDNRSFRLNFEINLLMLDRPFAKEVATMLTRDFSQATPIKPGDYSRTPALSRVTMHMARLFAPVL